MKNQREIYEALLAGETLDAKDFINEKVKLNERGRLVNQNGDLSEQLFAVPANWSIYKEPKWYENIPDGGVLCWVSDNTIDYQDITVITHIFMDEKKYANCNKRYLEAKPLTKQEIQVFMDNVPENM